jgi:hypothetical protein
VKYEGHNIARTTGGDYRVTGPTWGETAANIATAKRWIREAIAAGESPRPERAALAYNAELVKARRGSAR